MAAFIRVARVLVLIAAFCNSAFADSPAEGLSPTVVPSRAETPRVQLKSETRSGGVAGLKLALLTPSLSEQDQENAHAVPEPFNLPTMPALPSELTAKWRTLQARIHDDDKVLAACRLKKGRCPLAARRLMAIIELGHSHHGLAQLGWINRAVNLSIRPVSDLLQYGVDDFWASPLMTLRSRAGDCEDYAIVKYEALRFSGIASDDLRLVIVRDIKDQTNHAVLAVRRQNNWLILDNLTLIMASAGEAQQYYPLFAFDEQGVRTYISAAASR